MAAAEIARLRETAKLPLVHQLLDELEQARKRIEDMRKANVGMEAERDSARALLREIASLTVCFLSEEDAEALRARIDDELRKP